MQTSTGQVRKLPAPVAGAVFPPDWSGLRSVAAAALNASLRQIGQRGP